MQPQSKTIWQAIFDIETDERPECQSCQDRLYAYIDALLDGEETATRFAEVKRHLDECEACQQLYSDLKAVLSLERQHALVTPPMEVTVDFSELVEFSQSASARQKVETVFHIQPNWYERRLEHGRAWIERETQRWRQLWLSLSPIGANQESAPALAGLMSASPPATLRAGRAVQISPPGANLDVKLTVLPEPTTTDIALCRLEVVVAAHERFGDFSGIQVALLTEDAVQTQTTDAVGKVTFASLSCDQLPAMSVMVVLPD